jgi:hypothetical protein
MFQRISLSTSDGEELFSGISLLRSEPPPPVSASELPSGDRSPGNDNAVGRSAPPVSLMNLKAAPTPREAREGSNA